MEVGQTGEDERINDFLSFCQTRTKNQQNLSYKKVFNIKTGFKDKNNDWLNPNWPISWSIEFGNKFDPKETIYCNKKINTKVKQRGNKATLTWHASRPPNSYPAHIISSCILMLMPRLRCHNSQTLLSITGTLTCCSTLGRNFEPVHCNLISF